jgi:transcriptional regulator with XRE-family HTH domain
MVFAKTFGNFFKEKRLAKGLTLREFCRVNGLDPGNISKIERGLFPPPQSKELLLKYAAALGVEEGTEDWLTFCDSAITSAGKLPPDIVSNEEVMNALPVLFRTVRDKTLDEEDLCRHREQSRGVPLSAPPVI